MGIVEASESRSGARDVYMPAHPRGMAHRSYPSPDGKWILLAEMDNASWLPCRLVPFDGNGMGRPVGPERARCTYAAWSPDGRWMYFSSDATGVFQLWRQRFPDGAPEQFTFGPTEAEGIAMAPDGRSLFTSIGIDQSAIWIHDAQSDRQVTQEGFAFLPSWGDGTPGSIFSPDGKKLYYLVRAGWARGFSSGELWQTDLPSGRASSVFPGISISSFDISADGRRVVYSAIGTDGNSHIWLAPLDRGASPRRLTESEATGPVFGAAGDIVFRAYDGKNNFLYRLREEGGAPLKLTPDPVNNAPSVSPDGQWVVTAIRGSQPQGMRVVAMPTQGGASVAVCSWCRLMWTRDGKHLYLMLTMTNVESAEETFVIALKPGKALPAIPEGGIQSRDDLARLPVVRVLKETRPFPGADASTYAYSKRTVQRNLYRIPLR